MCFIFVVLVTTKILQQRTFPELGYVHAYKIKGNKWIQNAKYMYMWVQKQEPVNVWMIGSDESQVQ